jgi:hypothetical protein
MDLSKFPDTLPPVILHVALMSAMEALQRGAPDPLPPTPVSPPPPFDNLFSLISAFSLSLVIIDFLDNFLKLVLDVASNFTKSQTSAMMGNWRGKAKKMNGGPATANQVTDGGKRWIKSLMQRESANQ